ncbi:alpha/beta hydrolase [Streptomyces krungchingensis]
MGRDRLPIPTGWPVELNPPPFDGELEGLADALAQHMNSALSPGELVSLRAEQVPLMPTNEDLARDGAFHVEERTVPGPVGAPGVRLLVCRPAGARGALPVLFHLHGGGMIMGSSRLGVDSLLPWAAELGLAVVSVEYRLAPEHPYPAALDDCFAALEWLAGHAEDVAIDPGRIVVAGVSGGGGLAAALCLLTRDRGGPRPLGQMLLCPMLDDRNDSPSARQMEGRGIWDRESNGTAWRHFLGELHGSDDVPGYAAPARAEDLSGLPPAFLDVGSAETFRDEVVAHASRVWQAGGVAELHVWPGGFHGFDFAAPQAAVSREARAARLRWLRRLLSAGSPAEPCPVPEGHRR